ncbi:hypothetical protein HC891_04125 [Candidatus Gracilibacteria bacterium]|nr:hypothetical protein [Candidatus Gracilibacteria bacterium]
MTTRLAKIIGGLAGAAIGLSLLSGAAAKPIVTETNVQLPWYAQLVDNAEETTWTQKPGSQVSGPLAV